MSDNSPPNSPSNAFAKSGERHGRRRRSVIDRVHPLAVLFLMFCLMSGAAVAVFWQVRSVRDMSRHERFVQVAEHAVAGLEREIRARLNLLGHLVALIEGGAIEDANQFVQAASDLPDRFPGFVAINRINPARMITAVAPRDRNAAALGRRVGQSGEVVQLLEDAEASMAPRATHLVDLFQGGKGVATYFPVRRAGRFDGYVNGVLAMSAILEDMRRDTEPAVQIALRENGDALVVPEGELSYSRSIDVLNRHWIVTVRSSLFAAPEMRNLDLWGLGVAIGFSALAAGFLYLAVVRRRHALDTADRFAAFSKISSDLLWETDGALRFTFFAGRLLDVTERRPAWLLGRKPHDIAPQPLDAARWSVLLERLEARQPFRDEVFGFRGKDGADRHFRISGAPCFDAAGRFVGYRGTASNVSAEVTARAVAGKALDRLQHAVELMPAGFLLFDADENLVLANAAILRTSGLARRPVAGTRLIDVVRNTIQGFLPDAPATAVENAVQRRLAMLQQPETDEELEYLPGRWVRILNRRAPNGDLICIRLDITTQRLASQEREASQALLLESQRLGKLGHMLFDVKQNRVFWSASLFELHDVPQRPFFTFAETEAFVHPEDRGILRAHRQAAIDQRREFRCEVRIHRPDGSTAWQLVAGRPLLDAEQKLTGMFAVVQDISERKEAERRIAESNAARDASLQQLRDITDNLPVAITYADTERRLRFLNKTTEHWMATSAAAALGHRLSDLVAVEFGAALARGGGLALAGQRNQVEVVADYPDGVTRSVDIVYVPDLAPDGSARGYYALATDTTARKQTEEQLRQSQRLEAIGQLTGGVAHDFNNLLAVISGNLELLEEAMPDDARLRDKVQTAMRAAKRGGALTRSLLAFARQYAMEMTTVEVNALMAETAELLRRAIPENIEIAFRAADDPWPCVTDAGQLQNALLNLAINARDAMPKGGNLIIECDNLALDAAGAAAHPGVAPGEYITIAVTDNGSGMPPHVVDRAFEPFFTTKGVGQGTGLGLSMVYGFARQSNGHVRLESEVGRGSRVTLYLPRAASVPAAAAAAATAVAHGETILVVEDDSDVRTLTLALLDSIGYRVLGARGPQEASELLEARGDIDLLLTDVILSQDMNGPELADAALGRRPGLKVMFMSGYTENAMQHMGCVPPGTPVLPKPFRKAELAAMARAVLDAPAPASSRPASHAA